MTGGAVVEDWTQDQKVAGLDLEMGSNTLLPPF